MIRETTAGQVPSILIINPGSTSTKVALSEGNKSAFSRTFEHLSEELSQCKRIIEQIPLRRKAVDSFLSDISVDAKTFSAIAARGGLLRPLKAGTYAITDRMCQDLKDARYGEHASNLGALIALQLADQYRIPSFVVNPATLDEFDEPSRISGVPGIERKSRIHALNIKHVAMQCALELGKDIATTRFAVAHMGGGISVCAMIGGRIIDSTDALLGEGPFSLERAGTLPLAGMIELCFDRGLSKHEVTTLLSKECGFKGFFDVDRLPKIYEMINAGNQQAKVVLDAMIRQVVKWIGGMVALLRAPPDSIILTGGMMNSARLVEAIRAYIDHLGPIRLYPGDHEMEALAEGVLRVLLNKEEALEY